MSITRKKLTIAGVFSVTNAVLISLSIAAILLRSKVTCSLQTCVRDDLIFLSLFVLINTVRYGLYCHIFLALKKLLNSKFQFYTANISLSQAIWLNGLSLALILFSFTFFLIVNSTFFLMVFVSPESLRSFGFPPSLFEGGGRVVLIGIGFYCLARILVGITYILLAAEILRLSQILHDKPLKSLARTLTFTGWLIATILLAPLGFLLALLADALLGSIFLRTARES